ncbi:MAG: hypothetical protein ACRD1W_04275 [Vicinamibacterales bacterium]
MLLGISSCRDTTPGIRTEFIGAYPFTATERRVIARVAGDAAREARQHLPAFERDFAGASPPWGQYPDDVSTWVDELLMQPPGTRPADWIAKPHEDGRRWIGMRAGTYLVDVAMKRLHRTSAELVSTPAEAILTQR